MVRELLRGLNIQNCQYWGIYIQDIYPCLISQCSIGKCKSALYIQGHADDTDGDVILQNNQINYCKHEIVIRVNGETWSLEKSKKQLLVASDSAEKFDWLFEKTYNEKIIS